MKDVSSKTLWRFQVQGYAKDTPEELAKMKFGIRFPYVSCAVILAAGLYYLHIPTLIVLTVIAFGGVVLPNHPFDYLYNYGLRFLIGGARVPRRVAQMRFACSVATVWLVITIYLLSSGAIVTAQVWGGLLVVVALLVGLTDICLPSIIYNLVTRRKVNPFG